MDSILNPEIFHVGTRHYRKNITRHDRNEKNFVQTISQIEDLSDADDELDGCEVDTNLIEIRSLNDGRYCTYLSIPKMFLGFVLGKGHGKRKKLENEFSCEIELSTDQSTSSNICIKSYSKFNILNTYQRILSMISDCRKHQRPTHFICLPVGNLMVKEAFEKFRDLILDCADQDQIGDFSGINELVFHKSHTLHFTIVTLVLADEEVPMACNLLEEFFRLDTVRALLKDGPFCLTIQGLEIMNDDPDDVHVLYAKVDLNF